MTKTRKRCKNNQGGRAIASGGYGCVFQPALKCENAQKRESNKISKLMTERHAMQEYEEINNIKEKLDSIKRYENYFLLYDATICRPSKLTTSDLTAFKDKCTALPKDNITKQNINTKLDEVLSLNLPNGGMPIDDYIYTTGDYKKLYKTHNALTVLLKKGIIPMNKKNIYHSDIKDSNILMDDSDQELKARLIDWGLTVEYVPDSASTLFPRNWRNRPLQFNVPFSVIIFTDLFYEQYTTYLKDGGKIDRISLRPFVVHYLNDWIKERGAGHYKFINEIMYLLYSHTLTNVAISDKAKLIETQFTMPYIIDYIVDVLVHYTKYKENGTLNLREYLNEVYIHIVDIWGFITAYYPFLEMFSNNYDTLNEKELQVFDKLQYIFNEYLYTPRHTPYDMNKLYNDLKTLGNLLNTIAHGYRKSSSNDSLGSGIKTRKNKLKKISKSPIFKRKKFIKNFKNPFLLSIK